METSEKYIAYIGDFDFRNENVQSFLVRNNGRVLNSLDFHVAYIGINTKETDEDKIRNLPPVITENTDTYYELPNTLNIKGVFGYQRICKRVISFLNCLIDEHKIDYIITYQSPTYALILIIIAKWCKKNRIKYIVNCADLPIFDLQFFPRRMIMKANWNIMHKVNKKYADGVISVSKFIEAFYHKPGCQSVIIPPLFDESQYKIVTPKPEAVPSFIYAGIPFKITGHEAAPEGMKDRLDKIIDIFLALSSKSVPYCFRIVGIKKDDYLNGVPWHRNSLANETQIIFMGRQTHSETLALVAQSDFSVNFRDENLMTKAGFSTKIVESVSVGTPVIINPISDTFDYLEEGISGFSLNGSIASDAEKIEALCNLSEVERLQLKQKCYEIKTFYISRFKSAMNQFLISVNNAQARI